MEFTIDKNVLKNHLILASRFSSSKLSSTPILQGALIIADKNTITIKTTNLNDYFSTILKCVVIKPGKAIIDLKSLIEYLGLSDDQEITLKSDQNNINITKNKTKINFPIYQSEDFPQLDIKKGKTIDLTNKELDQINSILFSTSKDSSRPTLTGIHFCFKNNQNYIITTDGFRLSIIKSNTKNNYPTITISPSLFQETISGLTYSETDNAVTTNINQTTITSRIIAGDYPPFEKVIPSETKTTIIINRQDFSIG